MPALAKHMAIPPPMVPAPITAARARPRGGARRQAGDAGALALGEEDVPERLGPRVLQQAPEVAPFERHPLLEALLEDGAHGFDAGGHAWVVAGALEQRGGGRLELLPRAGSGDTVG